MYITGQKVICVNDQFPSLHRMAYQKLPEKGKIYTVRAVYLGRHQLVPEKPGASDGAVGILLHEIRNQDHEARFSRDGREPGFSSDRFAPFEEAPCADEVEEVVEISSKG